MTTKMEIELKRITDLENHILESGRGSESKAAKLMKTLTACYLKDTTPIDRIRKYYKLKN